MANTPLTSGGPEIPPSQWKAKFSRMYAALQTTLYSTYKQYIPTMKAPTKGSFSNPNPEIAQGVSFPSIELGCSPDEGHGSITGWVSKLEEGSSDVLGVDGAIAAQKKEWDELVTHQLANRRALVQLTATADGEPVTGETLYFGEEGMPSPPEGSNDDKPEVGTEVLYFGKEGMPDDPDPEALDTPVLQGYMLTGNGTDSDTTIDGIRSIKREFSSRWKVEKVTKGKRIRNVKDTDYGPPLKPKVLVLFYHSLAQVPAPFNFGIYESAEAWAPRTLDEWHSVVASALNMYGSNGAAFGAPPSKTTEWVSLGYTWVTEDTYSGSQILPQTRYGASYNLISWRGIQTWYLDGAYHHEIELGSISVLNLYVWRPTDSPSGGFLQPGLPADYDGGVWVYGEDFPSYTQLEEKQGTYHTETTNITQVTHVKDKEYVPGQSTYTSKPTPLGGAEILHMPAITRLAEHSDETLKSMDAEIRATLEKLVGSRLEQLGGYYAIFNGVHSRSSITGGYYSSITNYDNLGQVWVGAGYAPMYDPIVCSFGDSTGESGINIDPISGEYHVETQERSILKLTEERGSFGTSTMIIQRRGKA